MDKERQIRYNSRKSKDDTSDDTWVGYNEWWFLIINQNREIEEIKRKIYSLFAPIVDESSLLEGIVRSTGLRYKLLNFKSSQKVEEWKIKEIYKKTIKDAKLYNRETRDGLENYLADQLEK